MATIALVAWLVLDYLYPPPLLYTVALAAFWFVDSALEVLCMVQSIALVAQLGPSMFLRSVACAAYVRLQRQNKDQGFRVHWTRARPVQLDHTSGVICYGELGSLFKACRSRWICFRVFVDQIIGLALHVCEDIMLCREGALKSHIRYNVQYELCDSTTLPLSIAGQTMFERDL